MQTHQSVETVLLALAIVISASSCSPLVATAAPSTSPPTVRSTDGGSAPTTPSTSILKIGVVASIAATDVMSLNETVIGGAREGADDIGADAPTVLVSNISRDYGANINTLVARGYNIIVTVGAELANDTIDAAKANPNIWFIGVDQAPVCIDAQANPDDSYSCNGDGSTLLPRLIAIRFEEDQAGYLVGIVAAGITGTKRIGVIGGSRIPNVVRYIQGYVLGATSVDSTLGVNVGYLAASSVAAPVIDAATAKEYAAQFIKSTGDDVVFQVGGKTGEGILQAACAAGIHGIGVGVDQYQALNAAIDPTYRCIVTSAEEHVSSAVATLIRQIEDGMTTGYGRAGAGPMATVHGGNITYGASNMGIGISAFTPAGVVPAEIVAKVEEAVQAMQAGVLVTCPSTCGSP